MIWPFKKRRLPVPGEECWYFKDCVLDPWGGKDNKPIKILDVKDGWVRFSIGTIFNDERMKMLSFLFCYKPWDVK